MIDLGQSIELTGFTYLPRQDGSTIGTVDQYTVELSQDGQIWTTAADGEFSNIAANPIKQTVKFSRKQPARYVRFTAKHAVEGNCVSAAELGVLAK